MNGEQSCVVKRMIDTFMAKPIPEGCCTSSGRWLLTTDCSRSITIAEGAKVDLLVVDCEAVSDIDIDVHSGACLRIVEIVTERSATQLSVAVARDAECRVTQVVLTGSEIRVLASLAEEGARFEHNGVFILLGDERGSVTVDVNHLAPNCTSRTSVKGVASGSSHGSFSGLVYVAPDAQHTDSVQSSRNVTLGDAHIETLPQLEIYADDVKCSHGATVGQMDSDAILYMRQRGLTTAQAKRLQIEGFVQDVAMHCAIEELSEELMEAVSVKLNTL